MPRITYPKKSEFRKPIESTIQANRASVLKGIPQKITLKPGGYNGDFQLRIDQLERESFWVYDTVKDVSRFPARIRAAAWALFRQGCFGKFEVAHNNGELLIKQIRRD